MLGTEDLIARIAESVSVAPGARFFSHLVKNLASALEADCVCVGELSPKETGKVRVLAAFADGGEAPVIDYYLEDTPCATVVTTGISLYTDNVQQSFPLDNELAGKRARSYAGVTLLASDGSLLGILKVTSRHPIRNPESVKSTLAIFALRAASEIERNRLAGDLRASQAICADRALQLEAVGAELAAFSYSISHDFRAAVQGIAACSQVLMEDCSTGLDDAGKKWLAHIHDDSIQLDKLTQALVGLARVSRAPLHPAEVDLGEMARAVIAPLKDADSSRKVQLSVADKLRARGDPALLRVVMDNLLGNAWKFTSETELARIEVGSLLSDSNGVVYYVRDNGAGFDMKNSGRLFGAFQRLHPSHSFKGPGVGLATVRRIVHRHGGRVWAEGAVSLGATVFFTLGGSSAS